jgi:hypothetical protein
MAMTANSSMRMRSISSPGTPGGFPKLTDRLLVGLNR